VGALERLRLAGDYPLAVIIGPTASGKSVLALELAARLDGEIINYDSVQVYRGFDVGSGKLRPEERRGILHHLLDCRDPEEVFTAGDYRREALGVLAGIRGRRKLPVLVGGTGLYLRALLLGLFAGPARSEELRKRLRALAERRGREILHRLLARRDPAAAARIQPRDTQKLIRALEVGFLARKPISQMHAEGREGLEGFGVLKIGLNPPRTPLYQRINRRMEKMFRGGLIEEVRPLLARGQGASEVKPLGALGYAQACAVVEGRMSLAEALRRGQTATRHYAKRQLTWFRREPDITWFAGFGDQPEVQRQVLDWLGPRLAFSGADPRQPGGASDSRSLKLRGKC